MAERRLRPSTHPPAAAKRVAVIGGGWAGLAAAVEATQRGHAVTLFEMAAQLGGRARSVAVDGRALDNGQHILIGAYSATLALMRRVGAEPDRLLERRPLALIGPDGIGLRLPGGAPMLAFVRGVLGHRGWRLRERLGLLAAATGWAARGFRCDEQLSVAALTAGLGAALRNELIEPLCVAALNTPAQEASAAVFLRVLKDALFSGSGSADLLLPRAGLSELLPDPAAAWLAQHGAALRMSRRVGELAPGDDDSWWVDGEHYDRVVLATTSVEAARLTQAIAPQWSQAASALRFEPIVTVYLHADGARMPEPMLALPSDADTAPAQFVFDRGQLGGHDGVLAFVVSGAAPWVERGLPATLLATERQARQRLRLKPDADIRELRSFTERRATFRCTPGLRRPPSFIAPGLHAAADYVAGPYPATLEGAVRSALHAVSAFDAGADV
ncbi:MAG TPA: hydroxysqualene dehydroxylase HpnE [Burkholderiaceae bacterium]|nr:hydroxysqualene dehydroxylase HpnE [Burkholderiaceae bacterium]